MTPTSPPSYSSAGDDSNSQRQEVDSPLCTDMTMFGKMYAERRPFMKSLSVSRRQRWPPQHSPRHVSGFQTER